MGPDLAFATTADGIKIAWTSIGSGSTLIQLPGVPFSDVESEWRIPILEDTYRRLSAGMRLIQYDGRGTGRSMQLAHTNRHQRAWPGWTTVGTAIPSSARSPNLMIEPHNPRG